MKAEYLLAGGSMDKSLDAFITGSLDTSTVQKVTEALKNVIAQESPEQAKNLMAAVLNTGCAQDLHERGMIRIICLEFIGCHHVSIEAPFSRVLVAIVHRYLTDDWCNRKLKSNPVNDLQRCLKSF
jgi:hypothetical protein